MATPFGLHRLLQLLRQKQDDPLAAILDDNGDDSLGNLPEPRYSDNMTLSPEEMNVRSPTFPRGIINTPEEMNGEHPTTPQPLSDEDRIRHLFTDETPGMAAYREHVNNAPKREDYKPSLLRKILAGAASFTGSMVDVPEAGLNLGRGILNDKYNRATEKYNREDKGLGKVAELDERRKGREIQAEGAIENRKSRESINESNRQQRIDNENRLHKEELEKATDRDEKQREIERHNREMEKLKAESDSNKKASTGGYEWTKDKSGNDVMVARNEIAANPGEYSKKDTAVMQQRKEQGNLLIGQLDDLDKRINEVSDYMGPVVGSVMNVVPKGLKPDKVRGYETKRKSVASLLPILHGFRGGVQTQEIYEDMLGGLEQRPSGAKAATAAIRQIAQAIANGKSQEEVETEIDKFNKTDFASMDKGGKGKGKTKTLSSGKVITIED